MVVKTTKILTCGDVHSTANKNSEFIAKCIYTTIHNTFQNSLYDCDCTNTQYAHNIGNMEHFKHESQRP